MTSDGSSNAPSPAWLQGRGVGPELKWSVGTDGALTALALCRESGHVIVADEVGTLSEIDRFGKISAMTRLPHAAHVVTWSEDGAWGGQSGPFHSWVPALESLCRILLSRGSIASILNLLMLKF